MATLVTHSMLAADAKFASGTRCTFNQATAPVNWTKEVGAAYNEAALRIVNGGAVSSGGTANFSSVFTSKTPAGTIANTTAGGTITGITVSAGTLAGTLGTLTDNSVALTEAQMPSHWHEILQTGRLLATPASHPTAYGYAVTGVTTITYALGAGASVSANNATAAHGGSAGHSHGLSGAPGISGSPSVTNQGTFTGTAHNHTFTGTAIDFAVKYVDIIIAQRD